MVSYNQQQAVRPHRKGGRQEEEEKMVRYYIVELTTYGTGKYYVAGAYAGRLRISGNYSDALFFQSKKQAEKYKAKCIKLTYGYNDFSVRETIM